ncbi:MAG: [Fe-S]-binding protein, partial [Myxococcota bacterium]|nr:[Fe-S]-binding protein [Myxococcota bacterium]
MVQTTRFDSPIGELTLASTEKGLAYLGLPRANGRGFAGWHRRHAPEEPVSECERRNATAVKQVIEFLEGKRQAFDLELDLRA